MPLAEESLRTTVLLAPGKAAIAGRFEDKEGAAGERSFAVLAAARPAALSEPPPPAPAEAPPDAFLLRAHDVRFLIDSNGDGVPELAPETLVEWLRANVDPDAWRDDRARVEVDAGLLLATSRPGTHAGVAEFVAARARERARSLRIEVEELEGALDDVLALLALDAGGAELPLDWRSSEAAGRLRSVHRGSLLDLLGARARAAGVRRSSYFADVEVASGGTGFSMVSMPDPIIATARNGFRLDAAVARLRRPDGFLLNLDLKRHRARIERRAEFLAGVFLRERLDGGKGGAQADRQRFGLAPFPIDLPAFEVRRGFLESGVAADRDAIVEARELPEGRARVVIARCAEVEVPGAEGGRR